MARRDRRKDPRVDERESHMFKGSTRVTKAWYDADKRELTVLFPDGVKWLYVGITPTLWSRFKAAPSAGRFLNDTLEAFVNRRA